MIEECRITPEDSMHEKYLEILDRIEMPEFIGIDIKVLLYNELVYAMRSKFPSAVKFLLQRLFFFVLPIEIDVKESDITLFSVILHRKDHDGYWEKVRQEFEIYNHIQIDMMNMRPYFRIDFNKIRKCLSFYNKLKKIGSVKVRLYLVARLLEIMELKGQLIELDLHPKVVMCFFDGDFYSNFAIQFYKNSGSITITHQHGQPIFQSHKYDRLNQSQILNFHCDYYIAKGEFTKEQFINAGVKVEKIVVLGSFAEKCEAKYQPVSTNCFAVFLDCPLLLFANEINHKLINIAEETAKRTNTKYIIKLHPYDSKEKYLDMRLRFCDEIYHTDISIVDICEKIEYGILHASAIYVDLLKCMKKPYKYESNYYFPITKNADALFFSADELISKQYEWKRWSNDKKIDLLRTEKEYYISEEKDENDINRFVYKLINDNGREYDYF